LEAHGVVRHDWPGSGGPRVSGGLATIALRIFDLETPFGLRPLLYLVIMLEVLGFLLFGIGFAAEQIAQQQADIDYIKRRMKRTF